MLEFAIGSVANQVGGAGKTAPYIINACMSSDDCYATCRKKFVCGPSFDMRIKFRKRVHSNDSVDT